ncbi:MAG: cytochrome c oxidase subunit II [Xanthobacteraceae bacterium]|nr:cytochrome c oxidase subunit II [Xanthobacteraceae bacterium]MCW5673719.1 cytochrome c oxidase subunit II [Xanthobacteraceae bacterium]
MTKAWGLAIRGFWASAAVALAAIAGSVPAAASMGQPSPWQINFQDAASPIMEQIHSFHLWLTIIAVLITLFVLVLLIIVFVRFNEKANPVPSTTTHHTLLEVAWTVVPVIVLVAIAIPSFRLLFDQLDLPKADITIKATGTAGWTWNYEYPDNDGIAFTSSIVPEDKLKAGQPRLLTVDNEVVLPVNKIVRVQVTAEGIIHAFALPSFGVKIDAVPGRLNETWFKATKTGMFYGQCSELCGINHAYMPIAIRIVTEAEFNDWLKEAKKKFASNPEPNPALIADVKN